MTINLSIPAKVQSAIRYALLLTQLTAAVVGGYTYYHFFLAPTGVTFKETGKRATRAILVDMVLDAAVRANQTPKQPEGITVTPVTPEKP